MIEKIFGDINGLSTYMDLSYQRNKALVSNIANAETPMYKAVDIDFGSEVLEAFGNKAELLKTDANHLDTQEKGEARMIKDYSGLTKADGNNVDLDIMMSRLSYNSDKYGQAANILRRKFQRIDTLIKAV